MPHGFVYNAKLSLACSLQMQPLTQAAVSTYACSDISIDNGVLWVTVA